MASVWSWAVYYPLVMEGWPWLCFGFIKQFGRVQQNPRHFAKAFLLNPPPPLIVKPMCVLTKKNLIHLFLIHLHLTRQLSFCQGCHIQQVLHWCAMLNPSLLKIKKSCLAKRWHSPLPEIEGVQLGEWEERRFKFQTPWCFSPLWAWQNVSSHSQCWPDWAVIVMVCEWACMCLWECVCWLAVIKRVLWH